MDDSLSDKENEQEADEKRRRAAMLKVYRILIALARRESNKVNDSEGSLGENEHKESALHNQG